MPDSLNIHEPILVNTIGHSAGVLIFSYLLYLLFKDAGVSRAGRPKLAILAASLGLVWNGGSLIALGGLQQGSTLEAFAAVVSFSCLSLLPAALLSIALESDSPLLQKAGWLTSGASVCLHIGEMSYGDPQLHRVGLILITVVFTAITLVAVVLGAGHQRRRRVSRILAPMALVLFATSFVHFGQSDIGHAWTEEVALHHAGIPLALFVVLQDYRFLMVDAFVRAAASVFLALTLTLGALAVNGRWNVLENAAGSPFLAGVTISAACFALLLFASLRNALQRALTRVVFRRPVLSDTVQRLVQHTVQSSDENDLIGFAASTIASHAGVDHFELAPAQHGESVVYYPQLAGTEWARSGKPWVQVVVPIRFSRENGLLLLLGGRRGGQRFLSEDLQDLWQLALVAAGQIDRFRTEQVQRLAAEAELRALQAQINPHFLFNALNALYAAIPRQAEGARRTLLNLADLFRYFLQTERRTIPLSEEIRIIRAYLEIEQLRLGDRLHAELDVDPDALSIEIPTLSIEPLVENAVKHGIANTAGPGSVALRIRRVRESLDVEVQDTGKGFHSSQSKGAGVGLDNVRQRLRLSYGPGADLQIGSTPEGTTVRFAIPIAPAAGV